jgi:hypothetical protein
LRIESLEPREGVAKLARLDRSARGIRLRVEEQHDPPASELRECHRLAVIGEQLEVGGW